MISLQIYDALASFERGVSLFNDLQVKNIQLDSMPYILVKPLLRSGLFTEAARHSQEVVGMHRHSQRSIGDHLGKAYSFGSYSQVDDMLEFSKEVREQHKTELNWTGLDCEVK